MDYRGKKDSKIQWFTNKESYSWLVSAMGIVDVMLHNVLVCKDHNCYLLEMFSDILGT